MTKILEIFGYGPETKILEWISIFAPRVFTLNDAIKNTHTNRKRAYVILKDYVKLGLILKREEVKYIRLWSPNDKHPVIKFLKMLGRDE